ncbi:hypothetical protein HYH03_005487 [Edaphochlamys debaryana]|uniref:Uncharacterized protein n=1 Tax=Edaphochlamys debaryana TaxID=47281 RepID=A0A835Y5C6_9CHLO|nr:hypothetical protein HYH03_005487 [Edaphochlamys debaryana]|eukprot:KAG2496667.1 hypothetical protein HYH03_005487 [Edaphochlamys debaryana]
MVPPSGRGFRARACLLPSVWIAHGGGRQARNERRAVFLPAASVRPNPLFETSTVVSAVQTPQIRAAAALATAMVGYGFVRASSSGPGSGGSRSVSARAVASPEAPPLPLGARARTERLDQLYAEIEELKRRNQRVWELAMSLMEADASLSVAAATVKAAESMDLDNPRAAAAAAMAANAATAERLAAASSTAAAASAAAAAAAAPPVRPSGGAARSAPGAAVTVDAVSSAAAASVAASVAAAAAAGIPTRPSGGTRWTPPAPPGDTRNPTVPLPTRPGGASARSGPMAAPPTPESVAASMPPPDRAGGASARSGPSAAVSGAAGPAGVRLTDRPGGGASRGGFTAPSAEALAASVAPPDRAGGQRPAAPSGNGRVPATPSSSPSASAAGSSAAAASPNLAAWAGEALRKAVDPKAGAAPPPPPPPTYANPPPPPPNIRPAPRRNQAAAAKGPRTFRSVLPQADAKVNPSFDVPLNAAPPSAFLPDAAPASGGVTADGRVNPSFAPASVSAPSAPAATSAAAPISTPTPATAAATPAPAPAAAAAAAAPPPPAPTAEGGAAWYNPLSWFTRPETDGGAGSAGGNPSFDASLVSGSAAPLPEVIVELAEAEAVDGGAPAGLGVAAAASAEAWSAALQKGPALDDFGPVEQVSELLAVAMKTEEFKYPKYDPLRNLLSEATAPTASAAHKYDMLRGLLRAGKEEAGASQDPASRKYDLVYDLLQSLRASGDPAAILASADPRYDPVWSLLHMEAPALGQQPAKYDMVGCLLKAALAASPQPSRYDPLALLLNMQPITGTHKYCLAQVVLRGGWQQPLEAGLQELPGWDPLAGVVGSAGSSRAASPAPGSPRRSPSKYDMLGQALQAAASLPEDLASGKWAAAQGVDLLRGPKRSASPRRADRSKYDMVGEALARVRQLPDELASGKWAAAQGRELFMDTLNKTVEEGPWGLVRRVREGVVAVAGVAAPAGRAVARAVGVKLDGPSTSSSISTSSPSTTSSSTPTSTPSTPSSSSSGSGSGSGSQSAAVSEAEVKAAKAKVEAAAKQAAERPKSAPTEELPPMLFTFDTHGRREAARAAKRAAVNAATGRPVVSVSAVRGGPNGRLRGGGAVAAAAVAAPAAGVAAPPARVGSAGAGAGTASSTPYVHTEDVVEVPNVDPEALAAALNDTNAEGSQDFPAGKVDRPIVPHPHHPAPAPAPTAAAPAPVPQGLKLKELGVDLLVVSVEARRGPAPSPEQLSARLGPGFAPLASQLNAVRRDTALLSRHPTISRIVAAASTAGDGSDMWSHLYQLLGATREAEGAMPAFLSDLAPRAPLLHGLLSSGDSGHAVSVLVSLSNLVPSGRSVPVKG